MAKPKKQRALPGLERKTVSEVDTAAEQYVEARDERMALTEKEVEARDVLIAVMKKHSLDIYRDESTDPPLVVTLIPGQDKVKVARANEDDDGDDHPASEAEIDITPPKALGPKRRRSAPVNGTPLG